MFNRGWGWLVVLLWLIVVVLIVVGIIMVRAAWTDPTQQETSLIWFYIALALALIGGIVAAILQTRDVPTCRLPFSQQTVQLVPKGYAPVGYPDNI